MIPSMRVEPDTDDNGPGSTLLPIDTGEMRFLTSKFSTIGASDWEKQWAASCDRHLKWSTSLSMAS